MQTACERQTSGMLTLIGLEEARVEQLCSRCREALPNSEICIANYLFPKGYVISGDKDSITKMREFVAGENGVTVKDVATSGAFHSSFMASAIPRLQEALAKADIFLPRVPVYSNVTGLPYSDTEEIRTLLAEQIVRPVVWEGTIKNIIERENVCVGRQREDWGEGETEFKEGQNEGEGDLKFLEIGPGRQLRAMLKRIDKNAYKKSANFEA